jgi:large subunit ribosomal protein L9
VEVILLEKIHRLGNLGEKVSVKPGYGRNYLIPARKAVPATAENIAKFEERRAELEKAEAQATAAAEKRAKAIEGLSLSITAKVGPEGKLFGSVGPAEIVEAAAAKGVELERKEIRLPEGPLRHVGTHQVEIALHGDLTVEIEITVVGEAGGVDVLAVESAETPEAPESPEADA